MNTPHANSRKTGILRLRHLREVTEAKAEEMDALRPRFERLADPASAPRVVSSYNLFQTPPELAARIAGMFPAFGRTLEPSAGLGRLYRAVRNRDAAAPVVLVEQNADCARELYAATESDPAATLIVGDFLTMIADRLGGLFDTIIMNPPFHMRDDVRHIRHALTLLAPGGMLVSVCAASDHRRKAFIPLGAEWLDLPAGAFRSEGTSVATALVTFRR